MRRELLSANLKAEVRYNDLTPEEERALIIKAQTGCTEERQDAETELIQRHMAFVSYMVAPYVKKTRLPESVLVAEGLYGLYKSIGKFKTSVPMEVRLIHCAGYWIRAYILKAIRNDTNIPYPSTWWEKERRISQAVRKTERQGGTVDLWKLMEENDISVKDRLSYISYGNNTTSINSSAHMAHSLCDEGDAEAMVGDLLPSEDHEYLDGHEQSVDIRQRVRKVLMAKDPGLWEVVNATEGLGGEEALTNGQAALQMGGRTGEWVRLHRRRAYAMLKKDNELRSMLLN